MSSHCAMAATATTTAQLPIVVTDFFYRNGVDINAVLMSGLLERLPRYIRIDIYGGNTPTLEELKETLHRDAEYVSWLPGFFSVPAHTLISSSVMYRCGRIYGMDVSSGMAVLALDVQPNHHVLDMCCAPGAKLAMIANTLRGGCGSVTGVDVSEERLRACVTVCKKYRLCPVRLFVGDGASFNIPAPSKSLIQCRRDICSCRPPGDRAFTGWDTIPGKHRSGGCRLRIGRDGLLWSSPRGHWTSTSGNDNNDDGNHVSKDSEGLYDRILLDADCTHDGSLKHILKYKQQQMKYANNDAVVGLEGDWSWDALIKRVLDPSKVILQRCLLEQAFELLCSGGILVYSTCSFARSQNEEIVTSLLADHPDRARIVDLRQEAAFINAPAAPTLKWDDIKDNDLLRTVTNASLRFTPFDSNTSGFFVAKILKL